MLKILFILITSLTPLIAFTQNYSYQELENIYQQAKPSTTQDIIDATGVYESYTANSKGVTVNALGFIAYREKDYQTDSTGEHSIQPIMNLRITRLFVDKNKYFWPFVYNLIHGIDSPYLISVTNGIYNYIANEYGVVEFAGDRKHVTFVSKEGFVFENINNVDGQNSYTVRNCNNKNICDYIIKFNNFEVYTLFNIEISDCSWTPIELLHPKNTKCPVIP